MQKVTETVQPYTQYTARDTTTTVVNSFFGDIMKWFLYADPEVYISDDKHSMKAVKIDDLPNISRIKDTYSNILPCHVCISKRSGFGLEFTKRGKIKNRYPIVQIKSGCATAYYETDIINHFIQKTSKLYLAQNDGILYIQNRHGCYFTSASLFDDYSFEGV